MFNKDVSILQESEPSAYYDRAEQDKSAGTI